MPRWLEEAVFRAHEADVDFLQPRELGEEAGMRLRVGHDGVGAPKRSPVDRLERARGQGTGTKATAVRDQRVRERNERIEDDGPTSRRAAGGGQGEIGRGG